MMTIGVVHGHHTENISEWVLILYTFNSGLVIYIGNMEYLQLPREHINDRLEDVWDGSALKALCAPGVTVYSISGQGISSLVL